jgi:hypothetical protein
MKYSKKLKSKLANKSKPKRTLKSKRASRSKEHQKSKRKHNKSTIKGGSKIYNPNDDSITYTAETHNGERFFRKMFYYSNPPTKQQEHLVHAEKSIVSILMKNPHPNIVKFFKVTNKFVDMEELNTRDVDIDEAIKVMKGVKSFLQKLGIAYIDWKTDNIGKDKHGVYKLFDFDVSGTFDKSSWLVKPVEFFRYNKAIENGCTTPKQIDDFSFRNFVKDE